VTYTTYRGGGSVPRPKPYIGRYNPFAPSNAKKVFGFTVGQSAEYRRLYRTNRPLKIIDGGGLFLVKFDRSGFFLRGFRTVHEAQRFVVKWQTHRRG